MRPSRAYNCTVAGLRWSTSATSAVVAVLSGTTPPLTAITNLMAFTIVRGCRPRVNTPCRPAGALAPQSRDRGRRLLEQLLDSYVQLAQRLDVTSAAAPGAVQHVHLVS